MIITVLIVLFGQEASNQGNNRRQTPYTHIQVPSAKDNPAGIRNPASWPVAQDHKQQVNYRFVPKLDSDLSKLQGSRSDSDRVFCR